jgi:hypothetical protein
LISSWWFVFFSLLYSHLYVLYIHRKEIYTVSTKYIVCVYSNLY